jgi:hypothetical protein
MAVAIGIRYLGLDIKSPQACDGFLTVASGRHLQRMPRSGRYVQGHFGTASVTVD